MRYLPSLLLLLFASTLLAQTPQIGALYFFNTTINAATAGRIVQLKGGGAPPPGFSVIEKAQVKVTEVTDDRVSFKYLLYNTTDRKYDIFNFDAAGNQFIFSMSRLDFSTYLTKVFGKHRGFLTGGYTVPIRLRLNAGNFEFESNLSIGTNIALRLAPSRFREFPYYDLSLGISLTKANLNPENSLLRDTTLANNPFSSVDVLSPTAFTPSLGLNVALNNNVSIGAIIGVDLIPSADNRADWLYQGVPWLGIGLNFALSTPKDISPEGDPSQPASAD